MRPFGMSLGESVMAYHKTPCLRLTSVHLPWLPSPAGLGNCAPVPLGCVFCIRGAGDIVSNVRNDVGGTVMQNASLPHGGLNVTDPL